MNSVRILDLELPNNKIESFDLFRNERPPVLNQHGTVLQYLNLHENPLVCNCRMKWISDWMAYYMEHAASWIPIRHSLASTKCTDRPGGSFLLTFK
jgi:hypothetical protein